MTQKSAVQLAFLKREGELEHEYFERASAHVVERLRDKFSHEDRVILIAACLDVPIDLAQELVDSGLCVSTLTTLTTIPMVLVAWADGGVTSKERQAILKLARDCSITAGSPSYQLLNAWLSQRPPEQLEATWKKYARLIVENTSSEVRRSIQETVLERCEATAKACGGFFGLFSVSKAEQTKIDEISALFSRPSKHVEVKAKPVPGKSVDV